MRNTKAMLVILTVSLLLTVALVWWIALVSALGLGVYISAALLAAPVLVILCAPMIYMDLKD